MKKINFFVKTIPSQNRFSFSFCIFKINESHINQRLDTFLKHTFDIPYPAIQKLLRTKKIYTLTSKGKISKPDYRLQISDQINYPKTLKLKEIIQNENLPQEEIDQKYDPQKAKIIDGMVIFEDENYLILNKISNISSQGGQKKDNNLLPLLINYYHFKSNISIIHRLDKNTTGLLILAKKKLAAQIMSKFLSQQLNIEKYYMVVVEGIPESFKKTGNTNGIIDIPLAFVNKKMKPCNQKDEEGENCTTIFQIIAFYQINLENSIVKKLSGEDVRNELTNEGHKNLLTLMKIRIKGGKKHQIRAHMNYVLKTPVLLDRKYGFANQNLAKSLKSLETKTIDENLQRINKNVIRFNGKEISKNNSEKNEMIRMMEKENFKNGEYFTLHAFQIFLKTDEEVTNFKEFLNVGEGKKNGEIMIKAKIPDFFLKFIASSNHGGENFETLMGEMEAIRF